VFIGQNKAQVCQVRTWLHGARSRGRKPREGHARVCAYGEPEPFFFGIDSRGGDTPFPFIGDGPDSTL